LSIAFSPLRYPMECEQYGRLYILAYIGKMRIDRLTEQKIHDIINANYKKGFIP
jgi:hypothetical protein